LIDRGKQLVHVVDGSVPGDIIAKKFLRGLAEIVIFHLELTSRRLQPDAYDGLAQSAR